MLNRLIIKNLTIFNEAELQICPGLNVIIGENGTGKTHLLKMGYTILTVCAEGTRNGSSEGPVKSVLQSRFAEKLVNVFRPDFLGRLVRRKQGRNPCDIEAQFGDSRQNIAFHFAAQSKSEVTVRVMPGVKVDSMAVFIPTREIITLYPNFVSVYEGHYLDFEETYRDLCILLGGLVAKGPVEKKVVAIAQPLEDALGGSVVLEGTGRFYLKIPGQPPLEMPLLGEGLRKLAMIVRIVATGKLLDGGCVFWDEPDASLNPRLIKVAAGLIMDLCRNGVQVFVATHSLFLLRELEILSEQEEYKHLPARFFGLTPEDGAAAVEQGDRLDDIHTIVALDEELSQSDRFMGLE